MLPVLLTLGPISISSFGFSLAVAFLYGTFLVWRLSRAWDLPEERILDLVILTFFGGLIGARLYFVTLNLDYFLSDPYKILLITKYPGMSFWGGFLGGWLSLFYFCRRFKLNFWQIADLAAVGFLAGLIFGDIGCFLGGCSVGKVSDFLGTPVVGQLGHRFPVSILEALILALILFQIWPKAVKFHPTGRIVSLSLILLGLIKFFTEFFRAPQVLGIGSWSGYILSLVIFSLGIYIYYFLSKKNLLADLKSLANPHTQATQLAGIKKGWYNQRIVWGLRLKKLNFIKLLRRANVKPTPKNF
jgi:phosphatidylglycerol---prolipoprotein diacylglyceryl transferase